MDVIDGGPGPDGHAGRRRAARALGGVLVVAVAVALAVSAVGRRSGGGSATPTAPATAGPSPSGSASTAVSGLPDVIVTVGEDLKELREVTAAGSRELGGLPHGATGVWATTLPTISLIPGVAASQAAADRPDRVVHVFGISGGHAFGLEVRAGDTVRADLGPASAVLEARESPVLVHAGEPATINTPGDPPVPLPLGWRPAHVETTDYAGVLVRPAGAAGAFEIASWSAGGAPQQLTSGGQLLGVTASGQAIWLDPSCPGGTDCRLFFGDIAGLHPAAGLAAPPGTRFATPPDDAVAYGSGGALAVAAARTGAAAGSSLLLLIDPWQGTVTTVPGSDDVIAGAGMFWATGSRLVFARAEVGAARLVIYDVVTGQTMPFGPPVPSSVRLLTAYGSADGVTVRP